MPRTDDLQAVQRVLETDRVWSAFALADLEPGHAPHCEWRRPLDGSDAVLLLYRAFDPPVLFLHGRPEHLRPVVCEIRSEPRIYPAVQVEAMDLVLELGYELKTEYRMLRMAFEPGRFCPPELGAVTRLGPGDHAALLALYEDGRPVGQAPPFFQARMLADGVYYGVRNGSSLIGVAGTHVVSRAQSVAAVGNVYTRRDSRGQGLGTRLTAAVVTELLRLQVRTIVLNVVESNASAIGIYERLGFLPYREFREGVAEMG